MSLADSAIGSQSHVAEVYNFEKLIPDIDSPLYDRTRRLIGHMVDEIKSTFSEQKQTRIYSALRLALTLHLPQGVRLDSQPFVNHLMDVPLNLMRVLKVKDADSVVAAILHDIVEDQAAAVLETYGQAAPSGVDKETLRELALGVLGRKFGDKVEKLVEKLTNHDNEGEANRLHDSGGRYGRMTVQKIKHRLYQRHVMELAESQDSLDQYAFAIKIADFMDNGLRHGALPSATEEQRQMKEKLADKRGPLFVYFERIVFPNLPQTHPLANVRDKLIRLFGGYYDRSYINLH